VYGVNMGGESGGWTEIFNSQAPTYGGINTNGNFGGAIEVSGGKLFINLPAWCLLMFRKG
jgi:1,4-alpha-glucan branching enzyme